jgi:ribosomal protein S18 acetylase RimI-like enzyme
MEIRALDATQRSAAVDLWERAGLTRPWNPPDEDFDRAVDGPTSTVLGGFDDAVLVATAMVGHDGHRGWVYYLAVAPDRRHSGVGGTMVHGAEEWLRQAGVPKLLLMVRSTNAAALGFYDALGFATEDVVVRSRWLGSPSDGDWAQERSVRPRRVVELPDGTEPPRGSE